jgi:hypothetical protein
LPAALAKHLPGTSLFGTMQTRLEGLCYRYMSKVLNSLNRLNINLLVNKDTGYVFFALKCKLLLRFYYFRN